jgi:hypothetical protein
MPIVWFPSRTTLKIFRCPSSARAPRRWRRGFRHHATLSIAASGLLVLERCLFLPRPTPQHRGSKTSAFPYPVRKPATRPRRCQTEPKGTIPAPSPPRAVTLPLILPDLFLPAQVVCAAAYHRVVIAGNAKWKFPLVAVWRAMGYSASQTSEMHIVEAAHPARPASAKSICVSEQSEKHRVNRDACM